MTNLVGAARAPRGAATRGAAGAARSSVTLKGTTRLMTVVASQRGRGEIVLCDTRHSED